MLHSIPGVFDSCGANLWLLRGMEIQYSKSSGYCIKYNSCFSFLFNFLDLIFSSFQFLEQMTDEFLRMEK